MVSGGQIYVMSNANTQALAARNPEFRWNAIAMTVFSELIHLARRSGGLFTDRDIDNAGKQFMTDDERAAAEEEMSADDYDDGRVGYRLLKKFCPGR